MTDDKAPNRQKAMPPPSRRPKTRRRTSGPNTAPTQSAIPKEVRDLLGPAPLTRFDDPNAYERLLEYVASGVLPRDAVEWIWLKDIVDLIWEARRLRRAKLTIIGLTQGEAVKVALSDQVVRHAEGSTERQVHDTISKLAFRALHSEEMMKRLDVSLARINLDRTAIEGAAYRISLDDIERIDRLITICDSRRDALFREMDRRRAALSRDVRERIKDVIDADFEETLGAQGPGEPG